MRFLVCLLLSGCQLTLSSGYTRGYTQTENTVLGEVRLSESFYKNGNKRIFGYIEHESDILHNDNNKGMNSIGVGLQIGNE